MEVAGYVAAVLIGVSLGLMGSGGSILTLPVLVYLFKIDPVPATAYSLAIVGVTALLGAVAYIRKKQFNARAAIFFGIPSVVAILVARAIILPAIPHEIFRIGAISISRDMLLMAVFAVLMSLAAFSMIRKKDSNNNNEMLPAKTQPFTFLINGAAVGLLTGLVGAGGGFLIIPVLTNLLKLDVKTAIGTSLIIIATNALAGFVASPGLGTVNWNLLLMIIVIAAAGVLLGSFISAKIRADKLKSGFGWFILLMGIYILIKEFSIL